MSDNVCLPGKHLASFANALNGMEESISSFCG